MQTTTKVTNPNGTTTTTTKHGTPYASTFGSSQRWEGALELDWQALKLPNIGTLGPGLSVGYTSITGFATITGTTPPVASAESTTLEILPVYLVGVFRLDVLMRQAHIPLVPYAKAGIGYALWRASNTAGTSVAPNGLVGEGHTWGTQLAVGLAFNIGVLDPSFRPAARRVDRDQQHLRLPGEYMMSTLDGIAQSHPLWVGTNTFAFGLAVEF